VVPHGEDAVIAEISRETVLGTAKSFRAEELQARDDARKAEFERPVAVNLATGLHHGDFRVLSEQIDDNSVDLIFTDPPYAEVPLYGDAARVAARILKPGGSFMAYAPHRHLPAVIIACTEHLQWLWECKSDQPGASVLIERHGIRPTFTPLLWFVKGGTRGDHQNIVFDSVSGPREKDLHPWQKCEADARYYIENLTSPGGLVVDFFAGSGTTAVVAQALGRRWISFEIDAATAEQASQLSPFPRSKYQIGQPTVTRSRPAYMHEAPCCDDFDQLLDRALTKRSPRCRRAR
jgi:DNA modification methylase